MGSPSVQSIPGTDLAAPMGDAVHARGVGREMPLNLARDRPRSFE
jgi:hypothetical protein